MPFVKKPEIVIGFENNSEIYEGVEMITLGVLYEEQEHGESDNIELRLEDREQWWKNDIYPKKGDRIELSVGYEGAELLGCGKFEIDEIEFSSPPDEIAIRGISANISRTLRQVRSEAYEGMTLRKIVSKIAGRHGFRTVFGIKDDVTLARVTQREELDLEFLKRLAETYGYSFKVLDNKLSFYSIGMLRDEAATISIDRAQMSSFRFRDKTEDVYRGSEVRYHNPGKKEYITASNYSSDVEKGDIRVISKRAESRDHAEAMASAGLQNANKKMLQCTFALEGNTKLLSGLNINVTGMGKLGGKYHITKTAHRADRRMGYQTEVECEGVS